MHPRVISAEPKSGKKVLVTFSNSEQRLLDVSPFLGFGVFKALESDTLFQKIRVNFGTLEWPGGIDLDPDFVWEKSIRVPVTSATSSAP